MVEPRIARRRISGRALILALAVPPAVALVWSLLMRPEPATLITPVLGPWAGLALGHSECTMASAATEITTAVVSLGLVFGAVWAFVRGPVARILVPALAAIWASGWSALALLSVVNTCS